MKKGIFLLGAVGVLVVGGLGCSGSDTSQQSQVVVYVSEDQVFSEPILKESTGAMNRLIAEKGNPQADVYWANEPIRAEVLKQKGISASYRSPNARDIPAVFKDPEGFWTGFSARARVLVVNNNVEEKPQTILDYTDSQWQGRAVIANPLFGTTTSEVAALFTVWGDEKAKRFLDDMKANGVVISTSNGESTDFVASGKYDFSLVDTDDGVNRMRQGKPITMVYPDQGENGRGCFIVPNAVVLIEGAPHPREARLLIDYLLTRETEKKLAFADCAQIPLHPGVPTPSEIKPLSDIKVMQVNYAEVAKKMVEIQPYLKSWLGI